jgi:hypothetical protein
VVQNHSPRPINLYYILDTKAFPCYAFFMRDGLGASATRLICSTTFGWNRWCISSSSFILRGCFLIFFFMVAR